MKSAVKYKPCMYKHISTCTARCFKVNNEYSQAPVGDREDHAVGQLPLLLHLSVELLIQGFTSVGWGAAV